MRSQGKVFFRNLLVDTASSGPQNVCLGKLCESPDRLGFFLNYNAMAVVSDSMSAFSEQLLCAWLALLAQSPVSPLYGDGNWGSKG